MSRALWPLGYPHSPVYCGNLLIWTLIIPKLYILTSKWSHKLDIKPLRDCLKRSLKLCSIIASIELTLSCQFFYDRDPISKKQVWKIFTFFFFLPVLNTSWLIICHSCMHIQAITDTVMFVGTGIVLAAFSTVTDTVRLVRTGIVLAAFSTVTDTVRLVRTGIVLAAFRQHGHVVQ